MWTPYGMPPWYGPPPSNVPVPPGTDPMVVVRYFEMMRRREERERKKEEAKKKDKEKDKKPEFNLKDAWWYFQAATILWFLSPFIGAIQHAIMLAIK